MGAGEVKAPSFTEIFENMCPYYLSIGMSYEQFWIADPELAMFYRKSHEIQKRRRNEELWLAGIYTCEALAATVGNMFSKGQKHQYPSEPKPITAMELEERKERERRMKEEQFKARFMARALNINALKGGVKDDH